MRAHRYRLPLAVLAVGVAAGAATLLLRPRSVPPEPAAVEETGYFSAAEIRRAEEFRGPQRLLGLAGLGVSTGALALLALRPPARVRSLLAAAGARPVLGGAAAGAGISLGLTLVGLPLDAVAHERARDVGLSTQTWLPWLGDVGKATAIGAAMAGAGGALAVAGVRRFPRSWWAPGAVAVVAVGAAFVFLGPVVLDPVFNRFTPLPDGPLRREVLELADRAGVSVGEVYSSDASRRTTAANAYVGGLGRTKRVVIYDNLLERFPPDQVRSVVAHELGHQHYRDLQKGLLWLVLVAPAATFLVQRLTERVEAGGAPASGTPAMLPALALAVALVSFGVGAAGNVLSRQVEARADRFALELTGEPEAFIGLERSLVRQNVSDPTPPAVLHVLFGTHPTPVERIGMGVAWRRENDA